MAVSSKRKYKSRKYHSLSQGFLFKIVGPFYNSKNKNIIRGLTLALLVITVLQVTIAIYTTEWSANFVKALEQRDILNLVTQIGIIIMLYFSNIVVSVSLFNTQKNLQFHWRSWLTELLIKNWMTNGRHYLLDHIPGNHDNPESRISEDIRITTESAIDLSITFLNSILIIFVYTQILWDLSGAIVLDFVFFKISIYGFLVWLSLIYGGYGSILTLWIGRNINSSLDARKSKESNFRKGLVTTKENSQAISLLHSEAYEQEYLMALFQDILSSSKEANIYWARLLMFTIGESKVVRIAFPLIFSMPRYFLGSISLATLAQSAQAFQQLVAALFWHADNSVKVAEWKASLERVLGLVNSLESLEREIARPDPYRILWKRSDLSILSFHDLTISRLDGIVVVSSLNFRMSLGERVLILGNMDAGHKLFKVIAGLWPWGEGSIELPNSNSIFFMPAQPYLPTGTLQAAICYPLNEETHTRAEIESKLKLVGLEDQFDKLKQIGVWSKTLSRKTQQRLGLVRLLLIRPKWILFQDAFDSATPEEGAMMFKLISEELPDSSMLTLTNEQYAHAFHERVIVL